MIKDKKEALNDPKYKAYINAKRKMARNADVVTVYTLTDMNGLERDIKQSQHSLLGDLKTPKFDEFVQAVPKMAT